MDDLEAALEGVTLPAASRVSLAPESALVTAYQTARLNLHFEYRPGKFYVVQLSKQVAEELKGMIDLWLEPGEPM